MLAALWCVVSKLVSPLWRTVEGDEEDMFSGTAAIIRHVRDGVVTQLCLGYGMIDDVIYFSAEEVLGGELLKEGDRVNCTALRDRVQGGWKAVRVVKSTNAWEDGGCASPEAEAMQLRPLVGTVTSFDGYAGYINETTYFPPDSLCAGYRPVKGDWVEAKYFINLTEWTTQAQSVAPLRYCRIDQVFVTNMYGNIGVVDNSVFFSLDSLLLPANYQPMQGHLVNIVMMESSQSLYTWRALCMAPCLQSKSCPIHPVETQLESIYENKGGLDVTAYGQFGNVMIGENHELVLWIQNKGSETHRLHCCDFAGWDTEKQFTIVSISQPSSPSEKQQHWQENCSKSSEKPVRDDKEGGERQKGHCAPARGVQRESVISPGERLSIVVGCKPKIVGKCAELLLLHFSSFTIGRRLEVTVGCEEANLLHLCAPYFPSSAPLVRTTPATHVMTVSAPKHPQRQNKRCLPNFLPRFPVPQALRDCVEAQKDVLVVEPCLGEVLSPCNMQSRFSALLWLEELHGEMEMREFVINDTFLKKGSVYLHLEVPGLSEGRPSLNIGDRVVLKKPQGNGVVTEYSTFIAEINDEDVSLRVNSDFHHSYLGEPVDVEFSYNRLPMRRCHQALVLTRQFEEILFPTTIRPQTPQWTGQWIDEQDQNKTMEAAEDPVVENGMTSSFSIDVKSKATQTKDGTLTSKPVPSEGHFFNRDLNPPQREAVKRILAGQCRPIPYLLFGPPGTGKTVTLIEAILQVYHFLPSSRILVCTPSNSAADLICVRLHESGFLHAASMARVNATYRSVESIPEELMMYSKAGENIHHAAFHRIVVSTCCSAGMMHNIGLQVGHFTHIFLDEASQALEPESLIPMSFISERDGQIVLAGDPCQLGPMVKSKLASAFGLGMSLMERLMANPLYSRHDWGYNPMLVTKLIYNYRSHEALLSLPSKLFYQGELCFKGPADVVDSLCQWKCLPKKGFPLLFHGTKGNEMREGNNPSWFNPVEAVQVMRYCCQMAKKLYKPVKVSDIGIISPYKKQCKKIRGLLSWVGLSDIKVGSVEEFQGQEFLVIILSTVRSSVPEQGSDLQKALGFLANPKRFNVAITRARALLLIVGNPHILVKDSCFRSLLQYCVTNGAYVGCEPPSL
ncbi:RNA helicase Mov10l1 [Parambassis ranga]|uniref:RNA helicase n=1 Tax=Parambassis ranga TaxID=210632 RepID=A0A6P7KA69_9TELE|nr:RNA helicase Mov10l1 [Parambassis ranga]